MRFRASNWSSRITAMFYTMTGCFPSEKFPSVLSVSFPAKRCVHPPANGNRSYWNAWKIRHCRKDKDWHKERLCASPLKIIFKNETNNNNNILKEEKYDDDHAVMTMKAGTEKTELSLCECSKVLDWATKFRLGDGKSNTTAYAAF